MKIINFLLAGVLLLLSLNSNAKNYLKEKYDLNVKNISIYNLFKKLEQKKGFKFSYNSNIIKNEKKLDINVKNTSLEKILKDNLGKDYSFIVIGSHIVITKKKALKQIKSIKVKGSVTDINNKPIKNAVIYDIASGNISFSDSNGKFDIIIIKNTDSPLLSINKNRYKDTLIVCDKDYMEVQLNEISYDTDIPSLFKKINNQKLENNYNRNYSRFLPKQTEIIDSNLNVYRKVPAQISFIPSLGTNNIINATTDNAFSLNVIGGISSSINGGEFGGIFNIIRENVNGIQVAGCLNFVAGSTNGLQAAGLVNINLGKVKGFQIAGIANLTNHPVGGTQLAGIINAPKSGKYILNSNEKAISHSQIAGIANLSMGIDYSIQTAGIINVAKSITASQISGLVNIAEDKLEGAQIAAIINKTDSLNGAQVGTINIANKTASGIQIGGILNKTKRLKGVQIGLINTCDTIEKGIQLGLINYVKKGYNRFELNYWEMGITNFAWKTGGRKFYNTLELGYGNFAAISYGIGYLQSTKKRISFSTELIATELFDNKFEGDAYLGNMARLDLCLNIKLKNKVGLRFGPSINYFFPDGQKRTAKFLDSGYDVQSSSNNLINDSINSETAISWLGWSFGFQF
ncbi:MAG: STN domain-containing protein [Marinifilaceae bacterium]|jgi:hypothetical protein|nr:STN domain-containing protein [Marinifilaceae bacterium]